MEPHFFPFRLVYIGYMFTDGTTAEGKLALLVYLGFTDLFGVLYWFIYSVLTCSAS